ncbi:sugar ABC transporter substrate-binding protein [Kaistia dalseonensis]|uniref:Multiple sugar transport system substrate-binding protein n=1 Tax=Kaistia dalseonensis TaxID=410840 RepID=A0ABU0H4A8_9HYPH|nr:sugar ABC transporter substrate-binding protein [Kaistia dalseonensis]MCX5494559.1 sugar ABC transporter substrate-binding protein [Kaistia dalseonensis]MDQ0437139.1 multiple sugar transport system substrate-binding protein [Kaistia dalseonensis]
MKRLTRLMAATAALMSMTALAAAAETATIWARSDSSTFMPKIVEAFNKSHENQIKLDIIPTGELVQKYATSAAGGTAPDGLSLDLIYTPAFAAAGQLEDITDWAKSLPYYKDLSPAHVKTGTYKDKIYGLPYSADSSVLIWNKKLFKQAGLDPEKGPTNWAEIEADAEKVNALGGDIKGFYFSGACPGCNIFTFAPLVWASGGSILSDDGSKATLNDPKLREAIDFYRDMVKKGLVPEGAQTDTGANFFAAFAGGNIGIAPSGAFAIGALNTQYKDIDYGVTFLPGKDGGWSSFAGGDNFVVTKGTPKLKVLQEFLDFSYSLEGQTLLASLGSLPVRGDIAKEALKDLDPRYQIAAEAMANGHTPYSVVFNDIINSANGPWAQLISEVFYGDDVDGSIKNAQDTMQGIIDAGTGQ